MCTFPINRTQQEKYFKKCNKAKCKKMHKQGKQYCKVASVYNVLNPYFMYLFCFIISLFSIKNTNT